MFVINDECILAIKKICKLAPSKSSNQAFECVHIKSINNAIEFTCGDGVSQHSISISVSSSDDFEAMVNAMKFSQLISAANGGCIYIDDFITIKNKQREFKIKALDPKAFPFFPDDDLKKPFTTASELMSLIDGVSFSAAVGDVRYMLNGVHICNHAVATNGHRMAMINIDKKLESPVTIPIEAIKKMDMDDGDVFIGNKAITVIGKKEKFICKILDGKYPNYERIIPKDLNIQISVDRVEFIDAIKSSIITSPQKDKSIRLVVGEISKLESSVNGVSSSVVEFNAEYSEAITVGFNAGYLLDAFSALSSEKVVMSLGGNTMTINQDGIFMLVMTINV